MGTFQNYYSRLCRWFRILRMVSHSAFNVDPCGPMHLRPQENRTAAELALNCDRKPIKPVMPPPYLSRFILLYYFLIICACCLLLIQRCFWSSPMFSILVDQPTQPRPARWFDRTHPGHEDQQRPSKPHRLRGAHEPVARPCWKLPIFFR